MTGVYLDVKLIRMNTPNQSIHAGTKMADLLFHNPYFMILLEHLEMSLVVQERTVEQHCQAHSVSPVLFLNFARLFNGEPAEDQFSLQRSDIPAIVKYLKRSHQYYIEEKYPDIQADIQEIHRLNPESGTAMLEDFFNEYIREVRIHLDYENEVVFPHTLSLYQVISGEATEIYQGTYSVTDYREHHSDIEEKLTDLKNLLIKYLPIKNDQVRRRTLLFNLFELEFDLAIHSNIEENILIPLVEEMEQLRITGHGTH
jgi:regulator of cell morphogenesis and NO signaling